MGNRNSFGNNADLYNIASKASIISVASLILSILVGIVFKKPSVTVGLMLVPIACSMATIITSILSLVKKENKTAQGITLLITGILTIFISLFLFLILRGLMKLT